MFEQCLNLFKTEIASTCVPTSAKYDGLKGLLVIMFCIFKLRAQYVAHGNLYNPRHFSMLSTKFKELYQFHKSGIKARTVVNLNKAAHMINTGETPLFDKTLGQLFEEAVAKWPEQLCLISHHQNIRITFSELQRRVDTFAAGLKKLGLKKGDRIGVLGPNDLEWYTTSLGATRLGLIVVAINPALQQNELVFCLQKIGAKAVIAAKSFKTQNYPKMLITAKEVCPMLEHIIIYPGDHVTGARSISDVESLPTKAEVEAIAAEQSEISCYDGCNIQFTSGSTGYPKATLLSHRSIVNNSFEILQRFAPNATTQNKICCNVPFFHTFGMLLGQMFTLLNGSTLVLEERSFNPVKTLEAIVKEKCNITYGTPTMWVNLVEAQQRLQLPIDCLKKGVIGGSPSSPELLKRIKEVLHINVTHAYGMTETAGITFQTKLEDDVNTTSDYVGLLSNHVEAMVVNENGVPVPYGKPGELWIRGYNTMMFYWNDEMNTKKILTSDGWLKTGDQFILHENGYGSIVGRLKDMLIRGGENIFPKEIEDFLISHPKILEVQVIGVYDEIYGEEVCACVKLRPDMKMTKEELQQYCKGKIAHFKIPRYVEFIDEYPKTVSGKIQKFQLKKQLENAGVVPSKSKHLENIG